MSATIPSEANRFEGSPDPLLKRAWDEICTLGLQAHIADLDAHGYTVIPPELASPNGLAERLLEACLQIAERRNGERPDLSTGATHANHKGPFASVLGSNAGDSSFGDLMTSLIFEDRVFEEALMNPVLLAVATYLCGHNMVLSSMGCFMKGPNKTSMALHADASLPSPLPAYAELCNMTYTLTPFNRANGGTAFVPGSHKWCRRPMGAETKVDAHPHAVAVECAPGSLVCWHSNTWHGAFNRTAPGLRVSVPVYLARPSVRTEEGLIGNVHQEMLDRHPARFAVLMQQAITFGYKNQADSLQRLMRAKQYMEAYYKELGVDPSGSMHGLYY